MSLYNIFFEDFTIPVLASGKGWIVVDKPCGLSIHNDPGRDLCSIVGDDFKKNRELSEQQAYDRNSGVNPVNRIDRDTSGIILLGLNKETTAFLGRQFQERSVVKKYIALVHGYPDLEKTGDFWEMRLTAKAGGRKNPAGSGKKLPCSTKYRVLEKSVHYSLIECELLTGRKHQIRRHAKLNKTPITGDKKYGSPKSIQYLTDNCDYKRLGLHSRELQMMTPDGERLTIESPTPPEFMRLIKNDQ